ncbi:similar to Saccharomyces cerevisiae YMR152W YIM1 Protein of unknown function [Maudiozyma saulgeensis]|uniref:Enoyl reductase (ER) domain-containing protein n=1 Tax=Maudiozyma saulgeensis TaxID=1789683 RepID=A0A1X7R0U1_9SACH|nr:similar to Saccharomyces cerevisiae YMR152W YIM1 Protein of unknown function [Kazachstania saulgeensis]
MSIVTQKSITYVNNTTTPTITTKEIDLDTCYNENEIVVKVHAASINPVDGLTHSTCNYYMGGSGLKTFGRDFSGEIIRRGKNVNVKWQLNSKVNGQFKHLWGEKGTFTNYFICNPEEVRSINTFEENNVSNKYNDYIINASWPLVFGTGYSALYEKGQVWTPESKILIIGASTSVALACVKIAKTILKIGTVVGICNSKAIEHNKEKGFDHLIAYNDPEHSTVESIQNLIKNELNGEKFDLIFDAVGNKDFFPVMDTVLKPKSTNSQYITIVGDEVMDFTNKSLFGNVSLGSFSRKLNPFRKFNYDFCMLDNLFTYMELGTTMIADGTYLPEIDSVHKFEDYQKAFDRVDSHFAKGKVVLDMSDI